MSTARGPIRKVFDIGPTAVTSNGNYDGSGSPTTSWSSGLISGIWLSGIPQSDNDNGRIGQSAAIETFDLRVTIAPDQAAESSCRLRMLLVADKEYDGMNSAGSSAPPLLSEILGLSSGSTPGASGGLFLVPLNPAFFSRFQVIEDKRWAWTVTSGTDVQFDTSQTHSFYHETFKDMKGHRLMWDNTDADIVGSARAGHIFLYFIYEQNSVTTGGIPGVTTTYPPAIAYSCRLRYRDA